MKIFIISIFLIAAASSAPLLRSGLDSAYFGSVQAFPGYNTHSYTSFVSHADPFRGSYQYQFPITQYYQPNPITYYTPTYFGAQYLTTPFLDAPSVIPVQQPVIQPIQTIPSLPAIPQFPQITHPGVPTVENENNQFGESQGQQEVEQEQGHEQAQDVPNDAVDDDTVTIESA